MTPTRSAQFAEVSDAYASQHVHCVQPVIEAEFSGDDGQTVTAFDVRCTEGIARPRQLRQETQSRDCIGLLESAGYQAMTLDGRRVRAADEFVDEIYAQAWA